VVAVVGEAGKSFGADPRGGPWAAVIKHDKAFADAYAKLDVEDYKLTVTAMGRTLFDRDTAPGALSRSNRVRPMAATMSL